MSSVSMTDAGIVFSDSQTPTGVSGASVSSEVFDHYEEGSWDVSMGVSGTHGSSTVATTGAVARYSRIGNFLYLAWKIQRYDNSGYTGSNILYARNMPFNSQSVSNLDIATGNFWSDAGSGNGYKGSFYKPQNTNYALALMGSSPGDPSRYLTPLNTYWANNWYFHASLSYIV